jgi:hypothetical protein
MTLFDQVIGYVGTGLLGIILCGLFVRRRYRQSVVFVAYLTFILVFSVGIPAAPRVFYTKPAWLLMEIGVALLRFGVALELAYWIFRGFPQAALTVRRVVLLLLVVTLAGVAALPGAPSYEELIYGVVPRAANATVWLLTAESALVLWYRLPLPRFPRAVLIGLAPYLIVFTAVRSVRAVLVTRDPGHYVYYVETLAFLVVEAYWAYEAWRVEVPHSPAQPPGSPGERDRSLMGIQHLPGEA